jgi:hypothetical protein
MVGAPSHLARYAMWAHGMPLAHFPFFSHRGADLQRLGRTSPAV